MGPTSTHFCILSTQSQTFIELKSKRLCLSLNTALALQLLAAVLEVYSEEESGKGGHL